MSTNYYARVIPTKERKEELKTLIDNDEFNKIEELTNEIYGKPYFDGEKLTYGIVHLGKRASGWKFLWNPNLFEKVNLYKEEDKHWHFADSTPVTVYGALDKEHIKKFIDRDDVVILDEYDVVMDKEEFWNMALNWCKDDELDMETADRRDNCTPYILQSRQITFIKELIERGYDYKLNYDCNEFYSDGLSFCTTNEFS